MNEHILRGHFVCGMAKETSVDTSLHSTTPITHIRHTPYNVSHLQWPAADHRYWRCFSSGCSGNTGWRWKYRPHPLTTTSPPPETRWRPARSRWPLLRNSWHRVRRTPRCPASLQGDSGCTAPGTAGTPQSPPRPRSRWGPSEGFPATNQGSWRRWARRRPPQYWGGSRAWNDMSRSRGTWRPLSPGW